MLPPAELPDADFPFVLNTGRLPHQWHTMTKTGKIKTLNKLNPGPFVEINPEDAAALGLKDRDMAEIRSRRGRAVLPAVVTGRVLPGGCFVPFHWNDVFGEDLAINAVTSDAVDAASLQPEFKFCAVALTKVEQPASRLRDQTKKETAAMTHMTPADPLAAALNFTPAPPPALSEAETLYLSGFLSGLKTQGARGGVPMLPDTAPLAPPARLWINGVLAGLFSRAAGSAAPEVPLHAPAAAQSITLLWASQTGNSEALAERLKGELEAAGIRVQASCMADYPAGELGKAGNASSSFPALMATASRRITAAASGSSCPRRPRRGWSI